MSITIPVRTTSSSPYKTGATNISGMLQANAQGIAAPETNIFEIFAARYMNLDTFVPRFNARNTNIDPRLYKGGVSAQEKTQLNTQSKKIFDQFRQLYANSPSSLNADWLKDAKTIAPGAINRKKYDAALREFQKFILDTKSGTMLIAGTGISDSQDLVSSLWNMQRAFEYFTQKQENMIHKKVNGFNLSIDISNGIGPKRTQAIAHVESELKAIGLLPINMQNKLRDSKPDIYLNWVPSGDFLAYVNMDVGKTSIKKYLDNKTPVMIRDGLSYQKYAPNVLLHELSHVVHNGLSQADKDAIEKAFILEKKKYPANNNYGATNSGEFFATTSAAYFQKWTGNPKTAEGDHFPGTYANLEQKMPQTFALLKKLWGE